MKLRKKYTPIYENATALLRPKTGLNDMIVQLDPGTAKAAKAPEGWAIPIDRTLPNVNADEVLSALDGDTRDYLQLLVGGAGQALGANGKQLSATFKRFEPLGRDLARSTARSRSASAPSAAPSTTSGSWPTRSGDKDNQLATLVDSSNRVFRAFARQNTNLKATLQELPPTLQATDTALAKTDKFAQVLGPTLGDLRPGARALGPSLQQTRPFLRQTTPIIKNQLRPFAVDVQPVGEAAAAREPEPGQDHAEPGQDVQGRQRAAQRAGLQPAGQGGGLPLRAQLAQPQRHVAVRAPGRARADPPRPRLRRLQLARHAAGAPHRQPAARHGCRPAQRAEDEPGLQVGDPAPRRPSRGRSPSAEVRAQRRPHPRHGRASPCPASACCSSCGWPSAARCRSSRRATASRSPSRRPASSPRRPTSGSAASRWARSRRSSTTSGRAAPTPRSSSSRSSRRCRTTRAPRCARRRCWGRPTSSSPRAQDGEQRDPRRRPAAAGQRRPDRRARRDLPRLRRQDAAGLPGLDADAGRRDHRPRPRPQRRLRHAAPVRGGHERPGQDPQRQEPTRARGRAQHGHRLHGPQRAPGAAARPGQQQQPRLRHDRGARTPTCRQIFRALPTFEQESATTIDRLDGVRRADEPAR